MVIKSALIIMVILILMEDGSSIRKTKEEMQEDEEVAKAVNRTLAEEEEKKKKDEEDKKKENIAKSKEDEENKKNGTQDVVQGNQDEACPVCPICNSTCPTCNSTCPTVKPCRRCPVERDCPPCEECPESEKCPPCRECGTCPPCGPCPVTNVTKVVMDQPPTVACPEVNSMSTAVAMAVGACASLLFTGVATLVGLLLRYVPPTISGFLILAFVIIIWYLCSHYPETARQLGGRAATLLREAAAALSHRIMAAIRHHDQVGFSDPNFNFLLKNEFQFPFRKICTKIFYVEKINF
jgi:hypothetical protein